MALDDINKISTAATVAIDNLTATIAPPLPGTDSSMKTVRMGMNIIGTFSETEADDLLAQINSALESIRLSISTKAVEDIKRQFS